MPRALPPQKKVDALLAALAKQPATARSVADLLDGQGPGFGANALKASGKLYALFTQGTLVVKLPAARVAALIAAKVGRQFDPGHGRKLKEWLAVTARNADWPALATEAFAFVSSRA